MSRKKTQKEFEQEVYNEVEDEYTVLGNYKGYKTKVKIRHNKCGNEYQIKPFRFLNKGKRCPKCYATKRKTQEQFEKEVAEEGNNEYEVLGDYINQKTKIKLKHKICSHIWKIEPRYFLCRGTRCPKCSMRKSHEEFVKEVKEEYGDEYEVLGEYTISRQEVKFRHNKCGTEFTRTPSSFKTVEHKCPHCYQEFKSQSRTKSHEKFIEEVKEKGDNEYEVLNKYKGVDSEITFKHKPCGTTFTIKSGYFLYQGKRCPRCTKGVRSEGEFIIKKFLDKHNIKYKRDCTFDGCRNKHKLQYDFALFNKDKYGDLFKDTVYYLIEYNGIQHYEPIEWFGGQERLEEQKERDEIKKKYANDNGTPLLVIKYTKKEEIEDILTSKLL